MAPVMLFAFGPEDCFAFFCSTKLVSHRTSLAFTTTVSARLGIPYSLTLGPGENEYAAIYLNKETNTMWRSINYPQNSHLYDIVKILFAKDGAVSHPSDERISIGGPERDSNRPYVVVKGGAVFHSSNTAPLSASLITALDNAAKKPVRDLVLGSGDGWFLQYTDGTYEFDFGGQYQQLTQILQGGITGIQHLALSRYNSEHFFLVFEGNRKIRYSMNAAFESTILPLIHEYHASCRTVSGAIDTETETETTQGEIPPPYRP